MFDLREIIKTVDGLLPNSKLCIVAANTKDIELCITSLCPETGLKFGQAHRFSLMDLHNMPKKLISGIVMDMADAIRLDPRYNR